MVAARPNHTPSELAESAAKAVVTARNLEYTGGTYLDDLGWALGGQLTYERGLALFATAALDVATAAADSPGESDRRTITIDLDTGDWVSGGPITGEEGARVAASVLPGMPAEEVDRAYSAWLSNVEGGL